MEASRPRDGRVVKLGCALKKCASLLQVGLAAVRVLGELLGVPDRVARVGSWARKATRAATASGRACAGRSRPWGAGSALRAGRGRTGVTGTDGRSCPVQLEPDGGSEVAAAELEATRGNALALCCHKVQVRDPCALD